MLSYSAAKIDELSRRHEALGAVRLSRAKLERLTAQAPDVIERGHAPAKRLVMSIAVQVGLSVGPPNPHVFDEEAGAGIRIAPVARVSGLVQGLFELDAL